MVESLGLFPFSNRSPEAARLLKFEIAASI